MNKRRKGILDVTTARPGLMPDPVIGMAGDMFSAALVGLGVPASRVTSAMERAARPLGTAGVQAESAHTKSGQGIRIRVELKAEDTQITAADAHTFLNAAIQEEGLAPPYAGFARRTLETLIAAEREAHSSGRLDVGALQLKPIGLAHTPYRCGVVGDPSAHMAPSRTGTGR